MPDARRRGLAAGAACLLLALGCRADATVPADDADAALVLGGVEHTLVGPGGRRGTLRADSAVLTETLGTMVLIRPYLQLEPSSARPAPVELRADTGMLDLASGVVRLLRPLTVLGASAALLGRDTVTYDAAGDSLTATAERPPGDDGG
jgi:hypothetical protein